MIQRNSDGLKTAIGQYRVSHGRMMLATFIFSVASLSAQADDWPTYAHDNERSGVSSEQLDSARLQLHWLWQSPVRPQPAWYGPAKWDAYAGITGLQSMRSYDPVFHPIIAGGRVYFGSSGDDSLYCINLADGRIAWRFSTGGPVRTAPTAWQDKIYIGSDDGCAYCVDADAGRLVWKRRAGPSAQRLLDNGHLISVWPCRTGVTIAGGRAYFAGSLFPWEKSYLCAVDPETGSAETSDGYCHVLNGETFEAPMVVSNEALIVPRGRVAPTLFRRSDGHPLGSLEGGGGSFVTISPDMRVLVGPGNKTGWILGIDMKTRKKVAAYPGARAIVFDRSSAFILTKANLIATDHAHKKGRWRVPSESSNALILAGDTLFVGGHGRVVAFATQNGKQIWRADVEGCAYGLAVADGHLLVSTDSGHLYAFSVEQSAPTSKSSSPASSEPAVKMAQQPVKRAAPAHPIGNRAVLGHWVFQQPRMRGRLVRDQAGNQHAQVVGPIKFASVGNYEALVLDGKSGSVMIAEDHTVVNMPTEQFTAEAWVRIDQPTKWGSIVGAIQDNGQYEKGWLLGYEEQRFCLAVNGAGGPNRLTYLRAPTDFELERWYHVAGTYDGQKMRLFVDGREVAQSTEQTGPIQYPPKAYYEIGAYHDDDENFRMNGMIHEVMIHGRVLSTGDVLKHAHAKRLVSAKPSALAVGPWLEFTSPGSAMIRWQTASPSPTILEWDDGLRKTTVRDAKLKTSHAAQIKGLRHREMATYVVKHLVAGKLKTSPAYECDNFFNYCPAELPDWKTTSDEQRASDRLCDEVARYSLKASGIDRGICIVYGLVDGRLAFQLARHSRLTILCVDTDATRIDTIRCHLLDAGLYGPRIRTYHMADWNRVPMESQIANLVVSERALHDSKWTGSAREVVRLLSPYRGVAVLGYESDSGKTRESVQAWLSSTKTTADVTRNPLGIWAAIVAHDRWGHGVWTHQYGLADNSAFGGETLGEARGIDDFHVQWIGRPGPRYQADRNGRKPSPLAANGRLILQGLHRIVALDAHNGSILWSLETPTFQRFNMPRDCSNWCMDDQHIYAAMADRCWKIRAADGHVCSTWSPVPGSRKDWDYDWGYIANVGDVVIGSVVKQGSSFTNFWGNAQAGWYDAQHGIVTAKVCSENLFALDKTAGKQKWVYRGGLIVNPTIAVTDKDVFFVECRNPTLRQGAARRLEGAAFWKDQYLVALNLATGKVRWQQPLTVVPGTVVYYLATGSNRLALVCSAGKKYHVYCFDSVSGHLLWNEAFGWLRGKGDHGHHMSHPAIVGNRLYVRPAVLDLDHGKIVGQLPDGGCGTYACSTGLVIYRSANVTLWDAANDAATGWMRLRPGCWLSTIPACGMLLSPEAGGGCSCGKWLETSIGFRPVTEKP